MPEVGITDQVYAAAAGAHAPRPVPADADNSRQTSS